MTFSIKQKALNILAFWFPVLPWCCRPAPLAAARSRQLCSASVAGPGRTWEPPQSLPAGGLLWMSGGRQVEVDETHAAQTPSTERP